MTRKINARDVALAADVSESTVDRVLNQRGGVSSEKEARVFYWARQLGLDRSLKTRPSRTLRIAVLMQSPKNPFYEHYQNTLSHMNRTYSDLSMQFHVKYIDPNSTGQIVKSIHELARDFDGLIITSPDEPRIQFELKKLSEAIPVITLATDINHCNRVAYVGPDNRQAGRVAGDLMGRFLGEKGGEIILTTGLFSMIGHEEREMGFRAVLRERYSNCKISVVLESRENRDVAAELIQKALSENSAIRGIYNISVGSTAIIGVLRKLGLADQIVVIAHDLAKKTTSMLMDGEVDAVIDQNPEYEIRTAVKLMARFLGRTDADIEDGVTPFHILTRENAG